jgi:hypothetical protein
LEDETMLYWLPRLCLLVLAAVVVGLGLFPQTSEGVAFTLLMILVGLGLLSVTLHIFPPEKH